MTEELAQLKSDIQWIRHRLEQGDEAMNRMVHILDGNGSLGLVGKVAILWHGHGWVIGLVGVVVGALLTKWIG